MATKDIKLSWLKQYSHKVTMTYDTISTAITGAVNLLAGVDAGKHEIPIDGISEDDSATVERALNDNLPVYCTLDAKTQPYRIIHATLAAGVLTKVWIYPALQEAVADNDVISIGGSIEIDLGVIGEEGCRLTSEITNDETVDEVGAVYDSVQQVKGVSVSIPMLDMTVENFLMIAPNSFYIVKDSAVAYHYGVKKGFVTSPTGLLKLVPKDNTTDKSRTVTFTKVIQQIEEFALNFGGSERTKSLKAMFKSSGDNLMSIGDTAAAYT